MTVGPPPLWTNGHRSANPSYYFWDRMVPTAHCAICTMSMCNITTTITSTPCGLDRPRRRGTMPPARPKPREDAEDDRHGEEGYGTDLGLLADAAFRLSSSSSPPLELNLTLLRCAPPPLPLRAHRFGPSRNRRNATASSSGVRHGPVAPSASRARELS